MIREFSAMLDYLAEKYPVFGKDIKKDEVENNPSFFIYNEKGEITKGDGTINSYNINFYLYFITRENAEINEIEIIERLKKHGLVFVRTEQDLGKIENTDSEAKMTTFIFYQMQKVCYG